MNYYNEFNPEAAAWLEQLIIQGSIPFGLVDTRSITEVTPDDLRGFTQCHFFAGIGGWSHALQLAGWSEDRPVWTGSCPCQPFSSAGKRKGKDDERHLWPVFFDLIRQCRPATVIGEQVSSAIGHGWLDDLCADLEGEGYACGALVLPACGVGAFHKRDRLWWVGVANNNNNNNNKGLQGRTRTERANQCAAGENSLVDRWGDRWGDWVGVTDSDGREARCETATTTRYRDTTDAADRDDSAFCMADTLLQRREQEQDGRSASVCGTGVGARESGYELGAVRTGVCGTLAFSEGERVERGCGSGAGEERKVTTSRGYEDGQLTEPGAGSAISGIWDNPQWIYCRDNKYRPVESSIQPLAHGLPKGMVYSSDIGAPTNEDATQEARKMRLHGYGNAIVPQVAAVFVKALL